MRGAPEKLDDNDTPGEGRVVSIYPGQGAGVVIMFGALIASFAWGLGFHMFGRGDVDLRAHPIAQGGFFGWIILTMFGLGCIWRGYPSGLKVAGGSAVLLGFAFLLALATGHYR